MIGTVQFTENEKDHGIDLLTKLLSDNKDKTVEVPMNLLLVVEYFLRASCWYSDMNTSTVPYPSFEEVSSRLSYFLKDIITESNDDTRIKKLYGGAEYTIYKMLKECYSDEDIKNLLKGEWHHEI